MEAIAYLSLERLCLVDGEGPLRTAKDKFLNVALAAIPRISEIIAAYPAEHRAGALKVAARRYRRAAWDFGCTKEDSDGSVDAVMRTLQVQVEKHVIVQGKLTSLLHRLARQERLRTKRTEGSSSKWQTLGKNWG